MNRFAVVLRKLRREREVAAAVAEVAEIVVLELVDHAANVNVVRTPRLREVRIEADAVC